MKNQFLAAAVFLFSTFAQASDTNSLSFKYCHTRQQWLSSTDAAAAIQADKDGKINAATYEEIWYAGCNQSAAMEYARLAKQGKFDVDAFKQAMGKSCLGDSKLARPGAAEVAKASAEKKLDAKTFIRFWDDACEFAPAFESAQAAKSGKLDEKSFHAYYSVAYEKCIGLLRLHGTEAQKLALAVKNGSVDREAFLRAWAKTCKFDSAREAGRRPPPHSAPATPADEDAEIDAQ